MLTERNRAVLHRRLTEVVQDEEAVSEMLSNFPSDDRDPLVTRSMLKAELNALGLRLVMWMITLAVAGAGVIVAVLQAWPET